MPSLRGTVTEQNLKNAFAWESQANPGYLYFAQKADAEGFNDTAAVFRSTAEGGTVEIVASEGRLAVIDDGPGLAPDDHGRAFERFYLWDRYGTDRPVGTGLGLAIVAELAAAMGGRTTIESIPGEGSVFALELEPAPVPDHRAYARLTQR